MNALILALAYLRHNWLRSLVVVLVAALILAVPVVSQTILRASQDSLTDRAEGTPLVLGARGSQLDLVMNALYFSDDRAEPVSMAASEAVWDSDLGLPVPIFTAFETNGARIIGTSLDYFGFRDLSIAEGRNFAVLGEAVLGANLAERLDLAPGDTVISAPQNLFDLDGVYPLELRITGVLAPAGTPDDDAVFTDIKTTWVIAGIGHGHDDVIPQGTRGDVTANAALEQFNRITEANIDSFHFHGDPDSYPVSAVLISPWDTRSGTLLKGRYLDADNPLQIVDPDEVVGDLVDRIFRIKALLDAVAVIIGGAALLAVGLALFLGWRLRAEEMRTAFRLGAQPGMILRLAMAEIGILLCLALVIAAACVMLLQTRGDTFTQWLLAMST